MLWLSVNIICFCQQIAYEYAKKRANLVLVARRDNRLHGISENARRLGAPNVLIMAADVVKEEDCRRFVNETIGYYGQSNQIFALFLRCVISL